MRKKGFTLAELLGVLVVIALLLILIVPTMLGRLSSQEDKAKNSSNEIIYNAAYQYMSTDSSNYPKGKSGRYCIPITKIIDKGYLVEPVTDVTTGKDVSDKAVLVSLYSSGNTDYELMETNSCESSASMPLIDFNVTPKGSSWVQKRTAIIMYPKILGNYKARYRIDDGEWQYVNIDTNVGGTKEVVFTESSKLKVLEAQYVGTGEDNTDNIIKSKIDIVNIDSVAPKCTLKIALGTMGNNNWYVSDVKVEYNSSSDDLSGILDYGINNSSSQLFDKKTTTGKLDSSYNKVQSTDTTGITYYGYVKDKAGNIGSCNINFKRDVTKPTVNCTTDNYANNGSWSTSKVVRHVTANDSTSGVAQIQNNAGGSWVKENNAASWTLSDGTHKYDFRSVDNAGNISDKCSINVKVDTVAPSCSSSKSNTYSTSGVTVNYSCSDATSGVVSCPSSQYNKTSGVGAITIRDNAGNSATCPGQSVYSQTQYRRSLGYPVYGANASACGGYNSYSYRCGSTCTCEYCPSGTLDNYDCITSGAGAKEITMNGSCPSSNNYGSRVSQSCKTKYCIGYTAKKCYSHSNGTSWSGYGSWGTGNSCSGVSSYYKCSSQSRVVYY